MKRHEEVSQRQRELLEIEKYKEKLSHIKTTPVRINPKTVIFVREGKDPEKAAEDFRLKQMEATSRDYSNEAQY